MKAYSKIILFTGIFLFLFACDKSEEFSEVPYLEYISHNLKDSVDVLGNTTKLCELHLYFTDGDGDIGLFKNDTVTPYDYNLFVNYYEMLDSLTLIDVDPPFHIRIPDLTPTGQNKSLKADLVYNIDVTYRNSDTIKFELKLRDRALNESDWISSPLIFEF